MYEDLTRYIDVFSRTKLVLRPAGIAKDDGVGAAGVWYSTDPVYAPELEHYVADLSAICIHKSCISLVLSYGDT